ncbi:hypothetical protein BGZ46_005737 [Entomortierella lignicola]|nr:hypothetical protein BGZ46_005737 [Entomortierella lignicola]
MGGKSSKLRRSDDDQITQFITPTSITQRTSHVNPRTPSQTAPSSILQHETRVTHHSRHPDFHPPYPRPSRPVNTDRNIAYSMGEIRASSGLYFEEYGRDRVEDELERMRIEAYGPEAARSPSTRRAASQSAVRFPSIHRAATISNTSQQRRISASAPVSHAYPNRSDRHEAEIARIRESSGVNL